MEVAGSRSTEIHGWGCTPTGDPPPAAVTSQSQPPTCLPSALHRGWRRSALYCIIVFLMILVFLNIALTLWIVSALKLSMSGIGPIKIVKGGIHLDGQAWLVDRLVSSVISSPPAQPITVRSHRNFTVLVSELGRYQAGLFMKRDLIQCRGKTLEVLDNRGASVFKASKDEVRVSAEVLTVDSPGGVTVKNTLQAATVRAPPGSDLLLESSTRRLDLRAPQSIYLESRAGNIDITSHSNIKLDSIVGAIKMDAANIIINNLKEANLTSEPHKNARSTRVYQLCVCASGKLFLAAPDSLCEAIDNDTELCR